MAINVQRFLLLTIGLLFCVLGCTRERVDVTMLDDHSAPMETHEPIDVEAAFEQNLLPILTARCALSGCHVADGPHGLDFRTYESFIAGGEHGPAFTPGNAEESEIVEQTVGFSESSPQPITLKSMIPTSRAGITKPFRIIYFPHSSRHTRQNRCYNFIFNAPQTVGNFCAGSTANPLLAPKFWNTSASVSGRL